MHAGQGEGLTDKEPSEVTSERLSSALGRAVADCWSTLPQDTQHDLFEAAVKSEGEHVRQQLAIFLHRKHDRTLSALQSQATVEPDSLGG
jgi:hypothetical protein